MGPAMVQVIRNCGQAAEARSNMMAVDFKAAAPGFFNFINNADGVNPIAATDATGLELIAPANLFGGDPETRAAHPGEFIVLYATGFGLTNPAFDAGEIPQNDDSGPIGEIDKTQMTVMFGEVMIPQEDIFYAGVAPCCAGLYQLVIRVPANLADDNYPVVVDNQRCELARRAVHLRHGRVAQWLQALTPVTRRASGAAIISPGFQSGVTDGFAPLGPGFIRGYCLPRPDGRKSTFDPVQA